MIRETERLGQRPFGKFTNKARFRLDVDKVPFYNIPDLTGFSLMPYVSALTPKIDEKIYEDRKVDLTKEMLEDIEEKLKNQPQGLTVETP